MRYLLAFFLLQACSGSNTESAEIFPAHLYPDESLIVYEGALRAQGGDSIAVELKLAAAAPGTDSYYRMLETRWLVSPDRHAIGSQMHQGKYSVLVGSSEEVILHIRMKEVSFPNPWAAQFNPGDWMGTDLYLASRGPYQLVMLDDQYREVAPAYTLYRRSDLFTVEGYFTHHNDTSDYFERNTKKEWTVARFACYPDVVKKYKELATEKFEGVYLKALSYTVRQRGPSGDEVDALVFKRILLMDSTAGLLIH